MSFYVYIIYSDALDIYYKGQTEDLQDRLKRHNHGYEKATKSGAPWRLIWSTEKTSRSEAVILESRLKNMSREKLKRFLEHYPEGIPKTENMNVAGPDALT